MLSMELQERMEEVIEDCMGDAPAPCVATCPLHIDAKGYVDLIKDGKYEEALSLIRETTPFPGILGRVCAHPCEEECNRQDIESALSIKNLKRFAAEFDEVEDWNVSTKKSTGKEIAVIGSGPAGATAAYDLQKEGHQVTIFEKLPEVGGMLRVGIPAYRLPNDVIDKEYSILEKLGVKIKLNTEIGKDISFDKIKNDYDAVFMAIGAHNGIMLPIDGSDLNGVKNAVDILRNAGLEQFDKIDIDKKVTIIGGGNVAMDVARTVWRLGAEEIHVTCLEAEDIMPAHPWEIEDAREEGIIMHPGWGPEKINGNDKVESITLKKCTSVFDEEGNFSPCYDKTEKMDIETDNVIFAVGQGTISDFLEDQVEVDRRNNINTDDITLQTDIEHVFAGGDGIGRPLLAIEAMAHGRKAAVSINRYLKGENLKVNREYEGSYETWLDKDTPEEPEKERVSVNMIPVEERKNNFKEVELPFSEDRAKEEADRCLECECRDCVAECEFLDQYCDHPKDLMERLLKDPTDDLSISYFCNLCETCTVYCPNDFELNNIFLDIRRELVQQGKGPLKGHVPVTKFHQPLGFSNIFTSSMKDKNTKDTKRVFFPGCSLSSYAPDVVADTYQYLQENLPGTGFILKCCGAPTNMVGEEDKFEERFNDLINDVRELGAEEIITACPDCTHNIISHKPDDIKVTTVYEVIDEIGLPEDRKNIGKGKTISIHDSCTGRHFTELHDSVRNIVRDLGLDIQEFEHNREDTRCCGFGGMVLLANEDLSTDIMQRRANETDKDVVTYCGACRESMTKVDKPAFHLLEMIFSDQWKNGANDADNPFVQWFKRWQTKNKVKNINS